MGVDVNVDKKKVQKGFGLPCFQNFRGKQLLSLAKFPKDSTNILQSAGQPRKLQGLNWFVSGPFPHFLLVARASERPKP